MSVLSQVRVIVPRSNRSIDWRVRLAAAPVVVLVVAAGVCVTGGLVTDDATIAMMLTVVWLVLAGAVVVVSALRWRDLAVAVVSAYAITTLGLGGHLLYASEVDRVVNEQVTTAGSQTIARGAFQSRAHETIGSAPIFVTEGSPPNLTGGPGGDGSRCFLAI